MNTAAMPDLIGRATGVDVAALAVVCAVGQGEEAAVAAILSPGKAPSPSFMDAIEQEAEYGNALLGFDDAVPPAGGVWNAVVDLENIAESIGVDRVLCLVTQAGNGQVYVARAYEGLEVTLLEAAKLHLDRFIEVLEEGGHGRPGLLH